MVCETVNVTCFKAMGGAVGSWAWVGLQQSEVNGVLCVIGNNGPWWCVSANPCCWYKVWETGLCSVSQGFAAVYRTDFFLVPHWVIKVIVIVIECSIIEIVSAQGRGQLRVIFQVLLQNIIIPTKTICKGLLCCCCSGFFRCLPPLGCAVEELGRGRATRLFWLYTNQNLN